MEVCRMQKKLTLIIIASLILLIPGLLFAGTAAAEKSLTVAEIVNRANLAAYYAGDDGRATVKMTITDAQKRIRKRKFNILRLDQEDGGRQMFYVYFKEPNDVKGMVFMVHKHTDREDDRWL